MSDELTADIEDLVRRERCKQISCGFSPMHDDTHTGGELAQAAAFFILPGPVKLDNTIYPEHLLAPGFRGSPKMNRSTPNEGARVTFIISHDSLFSESGPSLLPNLAKVRRDYCEDRIRDLVKGVAMAWAEIERLQRLAAREYGYTPPLEVAVK